MHVGEKGKGREARTGLSTGSDIGSTEGGPPARSGTKDSHCRISSTPCHEQSPHPLHVSHARIVPSALKHHLAGNSEYLKVIRNHQMSDTIPKHDASATNLVVGAVHFPTQHLVEGRSTSQDDRMA